MRHAANLLLITYLLTACAGKPLGGDCQLTEARQAEALSNIRGFMVESPEIDHEYYGDPLQPLASYNSSDFCTFVIQPVRPVHSNFMWDGSWTFRVEKQSLQIEKHYRTDIK